MTIPPRVTEFRCPSWLPGNDVKCERDAGHAGPCMARRRRNSTMLPGELIMWDSLPAEQERAS